MVGCYGTICSVNTALIPAKTWHQVQWSFGVIFGVFFHVISVRVETLCRPSARALPRHPRRRPATTATSIEHHDYQQDIGQPVCERAWALRKSSKVKIFKKSGRVIRLRIFMCIFKFASNRRPQLLRLRRLNGKTRFPNISYYLQIRFELLQPTNTFISCSKLPCLDSSS